MTVDRVFHSTSPSANCRSAAAAAAAVEEEKDTKEEAPAKEMALGAK